jgi:hypothetical protein
MKCLIGPSDLGPLLLSSNARMALLLRDIVKTR